MKVLKKTIYFILFCFFLFSPLFSASKPIILPLRERAQVIDSWLKFRLENVIPEIMKREKFDMWVIICREYNEDPVFLTFVPATSFAARRTTILVFFDRGKRGIERLVVSRYQIKDFYKAVWDPEKNNLWDCLAKVVKERDPQKIGINESSTFAFGDGLSASLKDKLVYTLGEKYSSRFSSAEKLVIGWLERRTPEELEVYPYIVSIAHTIIAEAFSNEVIIPEITTTQDVIWWMREKINELGLQTWFHPSVSIQRQKTNDGERKRKSVIRRGDVLHCDIGITYLRLNTDTQEHAYVLKQGERDAPAGLKKALKIGNLAQDILISEFKVGRTGNEILAAALAKAKSAGVNASIYTHPLGYHGHAAGPTIGLWDQQQGVPGQGDYPLYYDTCYAIELNIKTNLPEWNGQEIRISLEQDAAFTRTGVFFLDGRQTDFHLIK